MTALLPSVFDAATPRSEVLKGELRDEQFAARLHDVAAGSADPVYGDPGQFFANTYPTAGLKTLLIEAFGRLSGQRPEASPFIRLETSFGGGKTHNLIALWHMARGETKTRDLLSEWDPTLQWMECRSIPTAGLVGHDLDPSQGQKHDGIVARTIWGELAWQIGGAAGFEKVSKSDADLVAPGSGAIAEVLGTGPALIMIDELALYLQRAEAVSTPNQKSDLAEQTLAFLMTLGEYAASQPQICVVLSIAGGEDAFSEQTDSIRAKLSAAQKISARVERVLTPSSEKEIPNIVTHRLFRTVDPVAAGQVAAAYATALAEFSEQGTALPNDALRSSYAQEIQTSYPFHPELLNALVRKVSTIPNFQRTRGALRLLAQVVRQVWASKPADTALLHLHHIDLVDEAILNDLTSRLDRAVFASVVNADIVSPKTGSTAHCQQLDTRLVESGRPPYARRTGTTIFLHSLSQGIATGVAEPELMLAILAPGDDAQLVRKSLGQMLGEERSEAKAALWYLHYDGRVYLFKTEPSLEMVIHTEQDLISLVKTKEALRAEIRRLWKKGAIEPNYYPSEPADIPDSSAPPKLAILSFEAATVQAGNVAPPDLVVRLHERAGNSEGFRTYKNNVLFLVAEEALVDRMIEVQRRCLAIERLVEDTGRMQQFSQEQKAQLRGMQDLDLLQLHVAITRAYRYLFYPSSDAPKSHAHLGYEVLPAQDQGKVLRNQMEVIYEALRQIDKAILDAEQSKAPQWVLARAWPKGADRLSTQELLEEFAKRTNCPLVLDLAQFKRSIKAGIKNGTWIYHDTRAAEAYGKGSPDPLIEFSEEAVLYLPSAEAVQGMPLKGVAAPAAAEGDAVDPALADFERALVGGEIPGLPSQGTGEALTAEGSPGEVFQRLADLCHDRKIAGFDVLTMRIEGGGKNTAQDLGNLGLAIPQFGKGEWWLDLRLTAEFGGEPAEVLQVHFAGPWARYRELKSHTDKAARDAQDSSIVVTLQARFPEGLPVHSPQFETMRDVLVQLNLGRLYVTATPQEGAPA